MTVKQVDSKGRITLDKTYAGSTMILEQEDDGTLILRPAVTVPAREAWLWKNPEGAGDGDERFEGCAGGEICEGA